MMSATYDNDVETSDGDSDWGSGTVATLPFSEPIAGAMSALTQLWPTHAK